LAVYLIVQIGVAGLHHHAASKESRPVAAVGKRLRADTSAQDDDENACPLCSVLHVVKSLPTAAPALAERTPVGEIVLVAPAADLPVAVSIAHSRDPPFAAV
jgi:hypothetical protein